MMRPKVKINITNCTKNNKYSKRCQTWKNNFNVNYYSFSTSVVSKEPTRQFAIPSIGFSGAGFLGAYHVGVASCLLKHKHLLQPLERICKDDTNTTNNIKNILPPILTGVSAGAIVSASISAGVHPDNAMNVLYEINHRTQTKSNVILNSFTPGFSLIDQIEDLVMDELQLALGGSKRSYSGNISAATGDDGDYDNDLLLNRIDHGNLLHIGLTDRRQIMSNMTKNMKFKGDLNNYVYVSKYRDLKDIVAASILSSYIPIGTGPLSVKKNLAGIIDHDNMACKRAFERVKEMERLGFLKHAITGKTVQVQQGRHYYKKDDDKSSNGDSYIHSENVNDKDEESNEEQESYFLDGGLVNMFPYIDKSTVIVTPLNCRFTNPFIAPEASTENSRYLDVDENVSVGMNMQNARLFTQMLRSSDPSILDERFQNGYDDAQKFLKEKNLLTVFN